MSKDKPDTPAVKKYVLLESEIEKQAGEVAGRVIGRAADGVMDIAGNIVGGLFGDKIREWRTRNLVSALSKTADMLRTKGIPLDKAKTLPMGEAYAMFEEVSKQDDPTVQQMWSALLANAMDADSDVRIEPAFVSTLKVIGGNEARILRFIRTFHQKRSAAYKSLPELKATTWKMTDAQRATYKRTEVERQRLQKQFNSDTKRAFGSELEGLGGNEFQNAFSLLIKERCICIPAPSFSAYRLVSRSDMGEYGRIEMLDESKVEDALNDISSSINEHSGYPDTLPELFSPNTWAEDQTLMMECNYDITAYGERLLGACEPTTAVEDTLPTDS